MNQIWKTLLAFFGLLGLAHSSVPIQDFFPYGIENGDEALPRQDDAASSIAISFSFPFFGSLYKRFEISTNGIITFGIGDTSFTPRKFPLANFRCVAVYWTDSDPTNGGDIFYRQVNDTILLSQIDAEIRSKFIQHSKFSSKWAFILTYDKVAQYGCSRSNDAVNRFDCERNCTDVLLYQGILATDGVNSFTIFLYNTLDYTSGTAACDGHAQIGFNAGDNMRYSLVPNSNTPSIPATALTMSNVGVPGKWMFSIEGSDISEGCNLYGKLEVFPRKTLYFGHENITITGPCINNTRETIMVTFDGTTVPCSISNLTQIQCVAPYFKGTGSKSVVLTYQGTLYSTFLMVVDTNDQIVADSLITFKDSSNLDGLFDVTWNTSNFNSSGQISVRGYQVDISTDSSATSVVGLDYGTTPNTGSASFRPIANSNSLFSSVRLIKLVLIQNSNLQLIIVTRIVVIYPNSNCESHCRTWFNSQPSPSAMDDIVNRVSLRSPCAPAVPTTFPRLNGNFVLDEVCNPSNPELCNIFQPKATACYKSINNNNWDGYVVQCCYNANGNLMLGPPGGGSLDFVDSASDQSGHFIQDVLPYHTCCKCSNQCDHYYEKRPSIDSRFFWRSGWGNGGGDPHFKTIDGTEYTFNPIGEFVYLQTGKDTIQVRMSQFIDQNNTPKLASYFSAFALKGDNSDIIQIEVDKLNNFQFRINGQSTTLELGLWRFSGISLDYISSSVVAITTSSSLKAEITINGGVLHIILSIPESLKGKISGLNGDWDGNSLNDLKLPDGTFIPSNSTTEYIHKYFGMRWTTTNITSLFSYPTGLSWYNYQNQSFQPTYYTPPPNSQCNGNAQCNYDAYATGSLQVGQSNIFRKTRAAEQQTINSNLNNRCPEQVSVPNGKVTVNKISDTNIEYRVTCNLGWTLKGKSAVTCLNGEYDALPTCTSGESGAASIIATWSSLMLSLIAVFAAIL